MHEEESDSSELGEAYNFEVVDAGNLSRLKLRLSELLSTKLSGLNEEAPLLVGSTGISEPLYQARYFALIYPWKKMGHLGQL